MCDVAIIGEPNFRLRGQHAKDVGTRDAGWQRVVDPGDQLPQGRERRRVGSQFGN